MVKAAAYENWQRYPVKFGKQRGQEDGVLKACVELAAADLRGFRTCVCAITFSVGRHTQKEKGEKHVLPWYRVVGVA